MFVNFIPILSQVNKEKKLYWKCSK
jgi:hypothetical protein